MAERAFNLDIWRKLRPRILQFQAVRGKPMPASQIRAMVESELSVAAASAREERALDVQSEIAAANLAQRSKEFATRTELAEEQMEANERAARISGGVQLAVGGAYIGGKLGLGKAVGDMFKKPITPVSTGTAAIGAAPEFAGPAMETGAMFTGAAAPAVGKATATTATTGTGTALGAAGKFLAPVAGWTVGNWLGRELGGKEAGKMLGMVGAGAGIGAAFGGPVGAAIGVVAGGFIGGISELFGF
jgi:hypothetical protein